MAFRDRDPTLEEMLADPIVQLLMQADRIGADDVRGVMAAARRAMDRSQRKRRPGIQGAQLAEGDKEKSTACQYYGSREFIPQHRICASSAGSPRGGQ